jgi:alpha-L-fucosidase 2
MMSMHQIYFKKPARRWDEGIPLGNGLCGSMIWGDGAPLIFTLDRGDLWDKRRLPRVSESDFTFAEIVRLVQTRNEMALIDKFQNINTPTYPTKIPMGRLELDYGRPADSMQSLLDLETATAEIDLNYGETGAVIKTFCHAMEKFGLISISGSTNLPSLIMEPHNYSTPEPGDGPDYLSRLGYPEPVRGQASQKDIDIHWYVQENAEHEKFGLMTGYKKNGHGCAEIAYVIMSSADGDRFAEDAQQKVIDILSAGFEAAAGFHWSWWANYWKSSEIRLPAEDLGLERMWYITNYIFASCSRKGCPPMPLQGVWTEDGKKIPPWKGDYHLDLNVQMSYWHYMKANHMEEGSNLVDFLWNLVPRAREFARDFFDADGGLCLPSTMTIDGYPMGGWPYCCLGLTEQIWLAQAFDHYWRYTGDDNFLRDRAYPYLKGTAICVIRWLKLDTDGTLLMTLSHSPEIHDGTMAAWLTPNSNYDLSLLKYLFGTLELMANKLDNGEAGYWNGRKMLLPELAINHEDNEYINIVGNALKVSPDESCDRISHRHFSHAMAIHPLNLLNYNHGGKEKTIINATIHNLDRMGSGSWVGYSFAWMSDILARARCGEGAWFYLRSFWENFCLPNGFHVNIDYKLRHSTGACNDQDRPITLEGNMAAADALQEMLLQCFDGVLRVFPAIPDHWREHGVSFQTLRAEGPVLVSSAITEGCVRYIRLKALKSGSFSVENCFNRSLLRMTRASGATDEIFCAEHDVFELSLQQDEEANIESLQ